MKTIFETKKWDIIFTPPCTPQLQPIEMIWAYVKSYVARKFSFGRTKKETLKQIYEGFYGGENHEPIGDELCKKIFKKCHFFEEDRIEDDNALSGTLQNIKIEENVTQELRNDEEDEVNAEMTEFEQSDINDTFFEPDNLVQDVVNEVLAKKILVNTLCMSNLSRHVPFGKIRFPLE